MAMMKTSQRAYISKASFCCGVQCEFMYARICGIYSSRAEEYGEYFLFCVFAVCYTDCWKIIDWLLTLRRLCKEMRAHFEQDGGEGGGNSISLLFHLQTSMFFCLRAVGDVVVVVSFFQDRFGFLS